MSCSARGAACWRTRTAPRRREVSGIAKSTGVTYAVTTAGRWVGLREDPMLIPRLHPHDLGRDDFADWWRQVSAVSHRLHDAGGVDEAVLGSESSSS